MSEEEILAARQASLRRLRETGWDYPNDFRPGHQAAALHQVYANVTEAELESAGLVSVAGRIMSRRLMGKAAFAHVQDGTGRIQLYLKKDWLGTGYDDFKTWDTGDIIGAEGGLFRTRTGELTIAVGKLRLLSKSLRPLPEKYHGLTDREQRYRRRYLDLMVNPDTRRVFDLRLRIVAFLRGFFAQRGFIEVETPMMHAVPSGATARPFITHHNSLDVDLYLRVAPELYLKRLLVGGMDKVFELNRNFRNEGLSVRHNPEFTMLEFYQAYADCNDFMRLTEHILRELLISLTGKPILRINDRDYDLTKPLPRVTLREALLRHVSEQALAPENLHATAKAHDVEPDSEDGVTEYALFEKLVEPRLWEPTFITAYPLAVSPLARRLDDNLADRFELFAGGLELANGFSELNSPKEQAERLRRQADREPEAVYYDEDFINALEYGMPPAAGAGIGVDRLVMLLTGVKAIRDVILFPLLRPKY